MGSSSADRLESLERRVTELEDERAIRELLACYGFCADACLDEGFVELFTATGVMEVSLGPDATEYGGATLRWEGQEQLRDFVANPAAHHKPGFYGQSLHLQGNNLAMRIEGSSAYATSYCLVLQNVDGAIRIFGAGPQAWVLARTTAGWRIAERRRRHVGDPEMRTLFIGVERELSLAMFGPSPDR
jgi:hypothetical protein